MKILYVSIFEMPHVGGLSHRFLDEVRWLIKKGHTAHILTCPPDRPSLGKELKKSRITTFNYIPSAGAAEKLRKLRYYVKKIRELDREEHYDLFHAHDLYSALYCVLAGVGSRTVFTMHSVYSNDVFVMGDSHMPALRKYLFVPAKYLLDFGVEELVYRKVHKIICVSEWEEARARKTKENFGKVRVIRNGVDVHKFKRTPSGFRKRHGIAKSDVVFVFVGRFVHKNGPMLITRAASLAARKCPNAKFVFVGEGSQLKECKALAKELSLGKNALFLGYKKDVVDVLSGSDVFVSHVTKSMEGIGINVLEGMACKLAPLVGQDRITEKLFRDGRDALLVKEGNTEDLAFKMILLIKKPGLRRRIAQAAYRKIIDRFSIRNTLRLVEETLVSAYIERSK